jgi:sirohydrochlorin ferrochelatase
VLDALDEHGIPREWVLGVDPETLDVVLAVTDLSEDEVYDVDEQEYAQKTGTDEREKFSHLQGLADRLDELEGEASEDIREDLAALEERIDEALSAG